MDPYSFSASSLQVAEKCMSRYNAEYILRGRSVQGDAANVGIVCHGTLEDFLRAVFIRKDHPWDEVKYWEYFHKYSDDVLGPDRTSELYKDAYDLAKRWLNRPNIKEELESVTILSLESKNNFLLKTSIGDKPVNYIMDRLDQIDEGIYRVVDYKSNRVALSAIQLRHKLQARLYALMVQIKYPKAQEIWVQFDFLRHSPVEVKFTRDDNVVMYRELQRRAETIIETDGAKPPETLNDECGYCVRKASCKALTNHVAVGGILGKTPDELADLHYKLAGQMKASKGLLDEVENLLLLEAINSNLLEYETAHAIVSVKAPVRRTVDNEAAALILGHEAAEDYIKFSPTDIDNLIKRGHVTGPKAELLKATVSKKLGDPTVKVDHTGF